MTTGDGSGWPGDDQPDHRNETAWIVTGSILIALGITATVLNTIQLVTSPAPWPVSGLAIVTLYLTPALWRDPLNLMLGVLAFVAGMTALTRGLIIGLGDEWFGRGR